MRPAAIAIAIWLAVIADAQSPEERLAQLAAPDIDNDARVQCLTELLPHAGALQEEIGDMLENLADTDEPPLEQMAPLFYLAAYAKEPALADQLVALAERHNSESALGCVYYCPAAFALAVCHAFSSWTLPSSSDSIVLKDAISTTEWISKLDEFTITAFPGVEEVREFDVSRLIQVVSEACSKLNHEDALAAAAVLAAKQDLDLYRDRLYVLAQESEAFTPIDASLMVRYEVYIALFRAEQSALKKRPAVVNRK